MVILIGTHGSAHLRFRKCIYRFTPLAQRSVGDQALILTVFAQKRRAATKKKPQSILCQHFVLLPPGGKITPKQLTVFIKVL